MPGINLTRDEAASRAGALTVNSYDVTLDLTTGEETFRSETVVRFSCRQPGFATFVDLIAPAVREIVLNGVSLPVAEVVSTGRIALPELAAENELLVVADGEYMHTGEGLHRFVDPVDGETYLYSQFEVADARRVFSCFDQPDLKASFTFTITAPAHWQVVSLSPSPEPKAAGEGVAVHRFAATPRVSTYVTSVIAGPYFAASGELTSTSGRTVPLRVMCRASMGRNLDSADIMDITRAGFAHFEKLFDVPYPFEKYDQIFVPEFNAGAMENAGAITFTDIYVFRSKVPAATIERRALTILHELAHMWFGDLVTMRWWDDLWLNESFAEYASTRCQAEATRWATAWTTFSSAEKSWAYRQDQLVSTHPIVADIRDLEDVEVNFDGITYAKGASVLKQLVHWVGEEAFDAGLRRYFAQHAWGNTTLSDLMTQLEATSGRDLSAWADTWLRTAGVTTLRPLLSTDEGGLLTGVQVLQEAPADHPHLRPHRLAIGAYDVVDGVLTRTARVELDVAGSSTDVPELVGLKRPALLLLNDDDLAYAKIRLDDVSLATAKEHLAHFESSLPRTLVWGAAWDMTRDAELPAREFVELLLANIASVDDSSVAQTLLRQLASTLEFYVAREHQQATVAHAADRLLALLLAEGPGSDSQLLFARSLTGHARTPEQFAFLQQLLDGTRSVDGLTIDTEMRWSLLSSLVAGGVVGEAEIASELARDNTAAGQLQAASARAAIPTAEAKAAAWKSIVDDGNLPNAVQSALIGGFSRALDRELLAPYVEPYFECLTRVWSERTSEMASQIAVGLYPSSQPGELVLARTQQWLEEVTAEPALRRIVQEGKDGVGRSLRAQERDLTVP